MEFDVSFENLEVSFSIITEMKMLAVAVGPYARAFRGLGNRDVPGGAKLMAGTKIYYFTDNEPNAYSLKRGHSGTSNNDYDRLIAGVLTNVDAMGSVLVPSHVAGDRMVVQGADRQSRSACIRQALPELWRESMSSISAEPRLLQLLGFLLGTIGSIRSWNTRPEELAGKASVILLEPYGAHHTIQRIREASNMDLATMAVILAPK